MMTIRKTLSRSVLIASCALASLSMATEAEKIPSHTLNSIRKAVRTSEVLAVMTVAGEPGQESVTFNVDQTLMGQLPNSVELPLTGFYPGDLQKGVQYLISLRFSKDAGTWVSTGNYDLISEGRIRDIPVETYLTRASEEANRRAPKKVRKDVITPLVSM